MISKTWIHSVAAATLLQLPLASLAADWSNVPSTSVSLFYPGVATWESVLTKASHDGATKLRQKNSCFSCHEGEEADMAEALANADHPLYAAHEGARIANAQIQLLVEGEQLTIRVASSALQNSQISFLLDDGAFDSSALTGCWATCHQDAIGMPEAGSMQLTKYLSRSRTRNTRTGGGENYKSDGELQQLLAAGEFLELLGVELKSGEQPTPLQGYVLESRHQFDNPIVTVEKDESGSQPAVLIKRPLVAGQAGMKSLEMGKTYSLGMAMHVNGSEGAAHLVSLPLLFSFTADGSVSITHAE